VREGWVLLQLRAERSGCSHRFTGRHVPTLTACTPRQGRVRRCVVFAMAIVLHGPGPTTVRYQVLTSNVACAFRTEEGDKARNLVAGPWPSRHDRWERLHLGMALEFGLFHHSRSDACIDKAGRDSVDSQIELSVLVGQSASESHRGHTINIVGVQIVPYAWWCQ